MRYEDASQSGSFQDQGPIARDDADQLAAGDRGPATGNLISGAGTETGASGADSGVGARVTAVTGAGGQDNTFSGGQLRVDGEHGSLSVTARGDYVYRPNANVPENSRDIFTYTLSDAAGGSSQARLTIEIGKTQAVVSADAQRIVPGPDGVVVLPAGVELSDIRIVGRDLLITLPDGSQMLIVDGAVFVPQLVINDIEVPSTNLAALLIEQEPRPASGVPQSSGGNFVTPVGPLDPGTPLGDLLPPTQLPYTPPEFRDVGLAEEDRQPVTGENPLVQIDDDARPGGNAGGTGDDPDGVNLAGVLAGSGGDGPLTFAFSTAGAPTGFSYSIGSNGSLIVRQGETTVLTVTLNAQTGAYSVTQNAPIQHPAGANENNVLFTFNYTVTDRDGDSAAGTIQLNVDDDTPLIDVVAGADAGIVLQTDDFDSRGEGTDTASSEANFSNVFSLAVNSVGADGLGSAGVITYALGTPGGASGLTQGGVAINLYNIGGKVIGSTATSAGAVTAANTVFDVSLVGSNGVVRVTQYSQIDHGNTDPSPTGSPFADHIVRLADGLVTLTANAAISDRDGDSASDSVQIAIGDNIRFTDDGPSLTGAQAGVGVTLDESNAASPGFPISASSGGAVIVGAGQNFGADGQAATGAITYSIGVVGGGATTLRTAQGDFPISLVQTSADVITGTYDGGKAAFIVTINADGTLTVRQSVALEHNVDGVTAEAFDDSLNLAGLIDATIVIKDFDGDTATASTGIGNLITFKDDGPNSSLAVEAARDLLILDETQPAGSDTAGAGAPAGLASVTAGFADNFAAVNYGADGAGSVVYSLVLNGSDVASGMYALQVSDMSAGDGDPIGRGAEIVLNQSGNTITGSANGVNYFTIAIDPATGVVTFTQLQPVWNPEGGASHDEAAMLDLAEGMLLVRQTVTDSDGDSDSSSIDVGSGVFQIQDDGPLARADLDAVAAGTYGPETGNVLTGAGTSSGSAGADTLGRDGASVVAVSAGEASDSSFDEAGNLVVQGQYGVLTIKADGSYSYARDEGTPGGVDDVFTYTLRDTDGDTSEATLTIRIGNLPPTVNAPDADAPGTIVDEAGLPTRNEGEPQGSGEEAAEGPNGNTSETTSGTISFTPGDGPATVTIAGSAVTVVGQVIDTGEGLLTITGIGSGSIGYSYTLKDNLLAPNGGSDSFEVVVTDQDGQSASDTLTIVIQDDAPDARNDSDALAAGNYGPETGNVISGAGTTSGTAGSDTVGADNASVVAVTGFNGSADNSFDANGNLVVNGQYGVLTIKADGSYSYVRNPGTPGGVSDSFTYTLRDGDGDEDQAVLTIAIGNAAPEVDAPDIEAPGTVVFEEGLGARGESESEGSAEEAAPGANGDTGETTSGTINYDAGDGPATVTIAGVTVTGSGQVIDTGEGLLTITSIGSGTIGYSYTLKDNVLEGQNGASDSFDIVVTDQDGQSASDTLTITIVDDSPVARDDSDLLAAGTFGPETGNVVTGEGTVTGVLGRDTKGADNASVVSVEGFGGADSSFDANGDLVVNGQYGVLTIKADGSYSYVRSPGTPGGVTDRFDYTLRDGDGDESSAELAIAIADSPTDLDIPPAGGATTTVSEAGLPPRGGEPAGSGEIADGDPANGSDDSEAVSGSFTFEAKDGFDSITIGGVTITATSTFPVAVNSSIIPGTLQITGISYNPATGQGVVQYSFFLDDNLLGDQAVNGGAVDVGFAVTVRDEDGDSSNGTLSIRVLDDLADARADTDSLAAGNYGPATGNVITGADTTSGEAGRDVPGADGAAVVAVSGFNGSADSSFDANGNLVVNGQYGVLTIKADGSYSYARNAGTPGGVSDVFTYTLRDGDGDQDQATLTIAIGNSPPTVNAPDAGGDGTVVYEAGLGARGAGESEGSGEELAPGADGDTREATSGTITFNQGDGPATIAIAGVTVTMVGQVIDTGEGLLTITSLGAAQLTYSYVLKDNLLESGASATDSFSVTVTDADGQVASDTLTITIVDDEPDARNDSDSLGADSYGPETGNVITAAGTLSLSGKDVVGADNSSVVAVSGFDGSADSSFDANGDLVVNGQYGVLTIKADGSYSYTRNAGTPGGVSDVFTYTLRDGDGDEDQATLTISIGNDAPDIDAPDAGAPGTIVFEAGLFGSRAPGESEGSGEAVALGTNGDTRETTAGTITFDQGDGPSTVTIGGSAVTVVGQVIDTGEGLLTITSIGAGSIGYSYTLKDNLLGNQAVNGGDLTDSIAVSITDQDGQTANDTLVIVIKDDAPSAANDLDSVGNSNSPATGNVITGVDVVGGDSNATDGSPDLPGADGASVVGIASVNVPANADTSFDASGNLVVAGQYGTLTIKADGSYSYARANGAPLTGSDVFTYTLRDGDGDETAATLTVTIDDKGVTTVIPAAGGLTTTVYEKGLEERGSEPAGSGEIADGNGTNDSDTSEGVSGSIAFTAPDGIGSLTLGGVTLSGSYPQTIVSNATGTLTVTGVSFDPVTGAGSISYRYELADNTAGDSTSVSFGLVVTDSDGDTSGGNLIISIVDDTPTARADTDSVAEGASTGGNVIAGTGTISGAAGADSEGADGAVVVGVRAGGDTTTSASGQVGTQIAGLYGTLTLNGDGSYTYVANPNSVSANQPDVFTYTIRDGDGDESTTTLTITVNNVTLTPDLEVNSVNEAALDLVQDGSDLAAGTVNGSTPGATAETTSGQLTVAGATSFTLNGPAVGSHGVLQLNTDGSYTYTLTSPVTTAPAADDGTAVGGFDTFTYTATDANGNSVQGTIRIDIIDDVPTARDDSDAVTEGLGNVADGNVLTGSGGSDSNASDGVSDIAGADGGATVIGARTGNEAAAGGFTGVPAGPGGQVIAGTYGDLLIRADGSYVYTLKVASIPVGVTGESFTYRMRDGDGDIDVAQLDISFVQDARVPTVTSPTGTVFEDGLADGNQHGPNSETVTGSFAVDLKGETGSVTIGGVAVVNGAVFDTVEGTLTITGVSTSGTVTTYSYSYTLKAALTHSGAGEINPILDTVTVNVTDATGDSGSGTITISIVDDIPTAAFDSDTLAAGTFGPETGNVISGAGTTTGAAGADTVGADGAQVVGVKAGVDTAAHTGGTAMVIQGLYGKLTLQANGDYSYTRDPNTPGGVTDSFSYTLRDGDGDTAVAQLDIVIQDSPVTVDIPPAGGATTTVYEAALPARGSEPEGSGEAAAVGADGDPREAVSGSIGFTAPDGYSSLSLGGQLLTGPYPQTVVTNATGTLVVTGVTFDAATGAGTIAYTYTLADNTSGDSTLASFPLVVTDSDGDTSGGNLVIAIVDDTPTARNDTVDQATENASITFGVFGNDTFGADGVDTDNSPSVRVTFTQPAQGSVSYNAATGEFTFVPVAGQAGNVTFTYTIEDGDGDMSQATVTLRLKDDSVPTPADAAAKIDDDGLAGGNPGGIGDIDANVGDLGPNTSEAVFSGKINVNFGGDSAGSTITFANLHGTSGTVGTESVTYSWDAANNRLTASSVGRGDIFRVVVDPATGNYTVTLLQNILHASGGNDETSTSVNLFYRAEDGDGDSTTTGKLVIEFNDDTPTLGTIPNALANNDPAAAFSTGSFALSGGADGIQSIVIAANLTGITSGGQAIKTTQLGNVLTGYTDTDNDNQVDAGETVFLLTVTTDGSGQASYSFDLQKPLDGTTVPVAVGGSSSFGAGPIAAQVLTDVTGSAAQSLAVVSGYLVGGGFDLTSWLGGTQATGLTLSSVNGSTAGWGIANNNFNNGEFFSWDFGAGPLDDPDGAGPYTPPAGVSLPAVSFATFQMIGFPTNGDVRFVAHFTDGTHASGSVIWDPVTELWTYTAPAGKLLADIEMYAVSVGGGGGKVDLVSVGVQSSNVNHTFPVTVTVTDGDGDAVSGGFTVNVATGNTPSSSSLSTSSATTMQSSSMLVVEDSSNNLRTSSNTNNLVLMAGLAAGFGSMPVAASTGDTLAFTAEGQGQGYSDLDWTLQAVRSGSEGRIDALRAELDSGFSARLEGSDEPGRGVAGGEEVARFDQVQAGEAVIPFALDRGTEVDLPSAAEPLFGGGEIQMPAPDQMAMFAAQAGGHGLGPIQTNPALESVLADALSGGGLADVDVDRMIDAAIRLAGPNQRQPGKEVAVVTDGGDAPAGLATPLAAAVSGWDGGDFALLFSAQANAMEARALHADAVQPIANG